MFLVTGVTGHLGRLVADSLLRHGHRVRLMIRSADRPAGSEHPQAEVACADFTDPGSLHAALAQVGAAFLVCAETPDRPRLEMTFIDAATAQGVRVVKLSALGAAADAPAFLRWHHQTEEHLREHATGWTVLRANSFMDNLPRNDHTALSQGRWPNTLGSARVSLLAGTDLAEAATAVLTGDTGDHADRIHELTGPEALSASDIAATCARVLGHPVRPVDLPPDDLGEQLRHRGVPGFLADGLPELHAYFRAGHAARVTDTVERILHRPATSLEDYLAAHLTERRVRDMDVTRRRR